MVDLGGDASKAMEFLTKKRQDIKVDVEHLTTVLIPITRMHESKFKPVDVVKKPTASKQTAAAKRAAARAAAAASAPAAA
eukprot:3157961-Pyramimonas_sp.AAC.1